MSKEQRAKSKELGHSFRLLPTQIDEMFICSKIGGALSKKGKRWLMLMFLADWLETAGLRNAKM